MSERTRFPFDQAIGVAHALKNCIPCKRIQAAGSLRRKRADVGDIELLLIPADPVRERNPADLFEWISVSPTDKAICAMISQGVLEKRKNVMGLETYGEKNKLMRHLPSGIPVDLFSTDPDCWFVSLVIRTGSKETNLRLTMGAQKLGRRLLAYGAGVRDNQTGEIFPCRSERDVFDLCGVPYLEPEER